MGGECASARGIWLKKGSFLSIGLISKYFLLRVCCRINRVSERSNQPPSVVTCSNYVMFVVERSTKKIVVHCCSGEQTCRFVQLLFKLKYRIVVTALTKGYVPN